MEHQTSGHETTDAPVFPILAAGIGLAIISALVCVITYGMFRYLQSHPPESAENPLASSGRIFPPAPRLEVFPEVEARDLLTRENHQLSTYGWVDRKAGIVRIPISRAMDLTLERGFPVRKEAPKR
ncbi:MAG: hypothetical protein IANPNBLG_00654 [Bryobacteraceae bacterium]|nr:hypothetical protein [Bryobacteraceae bacterium]